MPGLFALALVLRLPTLALPLEGSSAVLASVADRLSRGAGWELAGQAPFLPMLTSVFVSLGLPATVALRWTDALLASALAPLLYLLLGRLGQAGRLRTAAALLMAVHPLGLFGAGGMQPGGGSAAGALLLAALLCLQSTHAWVRRTGAALTLLLCLSDPGALVFVPGLLWLYARAERAKRMQTSLVLVGGLLCLSAPLLWWDLGSSPSATLGGACLWLLVAGLGLLLPALPRGLAQLWSRGPAARVWLLGAGLCLLATVVGGPVFSLGLLPLVIAGGVLGVPWIYTRFGFRTGRVRAARRAVVLAGLVGAALFSLWVAHGGLRPERTPEGAARLPQLREALEAASRAAGSKGWIVLAVAENRPAEQASLADLAPDHWIWTRRPPDSGSERSGLRRLRVFPAATFEAGRSVAVVAQAGQTRAIETFDGAGIYSQEVIQQIGPYVVLRASRP